MRSAVCLACCLVALAAPLAARAQVPLLDRFGGPAGYGTQCLGPNDDGSSMSIDLTPVFPMGIHFFGSTHTTMFVNTNGNVTFSDQLPQYTPDAFPVAARPMIAPFWADVDLREGADCTDASDGGEGYAGACQSPSSNGVWWALDTVTRRVVVTWDRVGYYKCHTDKVMSFQLVLTPFDGGSCGSPGDFDVEFRFNTCQWNTGDASGGTGGLGPSGPMTAACTGIGGFSICPLDPTAPCTDGMCTVDAMPTPAQAGFDAGNESDFVEIPGSRTNEIHTILCTMSNVGEPGIWRFQIRSGAVVCPDAGMECDTGLIGVCGRGRTACVGGGTECQPEIGPSDERCDALDNDCDGNVDEGSDLCNSFEVCDRGTCVGDCFEGGCPESQVCNASGRCVDTACQSVECPAGQRCVGGSCVGACEGIVCPAGTSCSGGRCVDLCEGNTCDPECTVCEGGACVTRCQLAPCPGGQECAADGHCVAAGCGSVSCGVGQVCQGGACVDACLSAVCPHGDQCVNGRCYPGGMVPDGGPGSGFDGGIGNGDDAGPGHGRGGSPGCGCRATGGESSGWAIGLALALGLAAWRRRRG